MKQFNNRAGDPMPILTMPDLGMTLVRALEFIKGYCDKHARCENGCKLYQEDDCMLMRNLSPCDWDWVIKAVAEKEER